MITILKDIPIIIFIERIINFVIHIIHQWFDAVFPFIIIEDYSDYFFMLENNSYNFSKFNYGYFYNYRNENIKNSSRLTPFGISISLIGNHYYMVNRYTAKHNRQYTIRCINPVVRDFNILLNYLEKIKLKTEDRYIMSVDSGGHRETITHIIKPIKYIKKDLLNKISSIYKKELAEGRGNASILLYGPPGSGKSTNIAALSYFVGLDVVNITIESLTPGNFINLASQKRVILLFEDWFPAFIEEYFNSKDKYKNENRNFSLFLNLLSGLSSIKDCILIFTCNEVKEIFNEPRIYPLFRLGRINHIFELHKNKYIYKNPLLNNRLEFCPIK